MSNHNGLLCLINLAEFFWFICDQFVLIYLSLVSPLCCESCHSNCDSHWSNSIVLLQLLCFVILTFARLGVCILGVLLIRPCLLWAVILFGEYTHHFHICLNYEHLFCLQCIPLEVPIHLKIFSNKPGKFTFGVLLNFWALWAWAQSSLRGTHIGWSATNYSTNYSTLKGSAYQQEVILLTN